MIAEPPFFADLHSRIAQHQTVVVETFQPLTDAQLQWRPAPREWSILQCFDHLNQTHVYYMQKIEAALENPVPVQEGADSYRASFWGSIYMFFALNPRFSFPTPDVIAPRTELTPAVLDVYQARQEELLEVLARVANIDLRATRIPIERGVNFNLGDCLKILVYHDDLHIRQALRVHVSQGVRSAS